MCSNLDTILLMGSNRVTCQLQLREHGRAEVEERRVGGAQIKGGRGSEQKGGEQIEGGREGGEHLFPYL